MTFFINILYYHQIRTLKKEEKKTNKRLIVVILVVSILVASVATSLIIQNAGVGSTNNNITPDPSLNPSSSPSSSPGPSEDDVSHLEYTDETGNHSAVLFNDPKNCFDWIRNNTPEDAVFLSWFEYGHSLKGYALREAVFKNPSHEAMEIMAWALDETAGTEYDSNEKILDMSKAFLATDPSETISVMHKYGASYIFIQDSDTFRMHWSARLLGLDFTNYCMGYNDDGTPSPSLGLSQTVIYKLSQDGVAGFTLVYEDAVAKVYKID